jgi:hypothetical protein
MKWSKWLQKWEMSSLKIATPFMEMEWAPQDADRDAAWELYVELLTRIATQPLPRDEGDEASALESVYSIFGLTREIIRKHGRNCAEFTKIAIVVLNQIIRPFTATWHKKSLAGAFEDARERAAFRNELEALQQVLETYTQMLAEMAGVEDLTHLERREE